MEGCNCCTNLEEYEFYVRRWARHDSSVPIFNSDAAHRDILLKYMYGKASKSKPIKMLSYHPKSFLKLLRTVDKSVPIEIISFVPLTSIAIKKFQKKNIKLYYYDIPCTFQDSIVIDKHITRVEKKVAHNEYDSVGNFNNRLLGGKLDEVFELIRSKSERLV